MSRFTRFLLLSAVISLTGCETVGSTMAGIGQKVRNIELPKLSSSAKKAEDVPPEAALVAAKTVDCPRVGVVGDLNSLTQQQAGKQISSARLAGIGSQCAINESNIIVDMDIDFEGTADPAAKAVSTDVPSFSYPYFIAITTPSGDIAAKEVFTATISYASDEFKKHHTEQMRQVIPMTGEYNPRDYEILVGFQLTPDELAYNRSQVAEGKGPAPTQIESRKGNTAPATASPAAPAPIPEASAPPPVRHEQPTAISTPVPRGPNDAPDSSISAISATDMSGSDMSGTFVPDPAPKTAATPSSAPLPEPVIEPTPNADPLPMPEETSGKPLYPVATGTAPPPPQKIVPRVESDVGYGR